MPVIYTTQHNVQIMVDPGSKSDNDFIVRYREPGKRVRTPKHIHLVVDIFAKKTGNKDLTNQFIDRIIYIIEHMKPSETYPPKLQHFSLSDSQIFSPLNAFGEYEVEFLMVVAELIMIQEKTNYPNGKLNLNIFHKMRDGEDIFSIVSAATFR